MDIEQLLENYDQNLSLYYNKVDPILNSYLINGRKRYEKLLKGLYDFYIFMSYQLDEQIIPNDDTIDTVRGLYAKSALTLYAIYTCLYNGLSSEASSLLRCLFEIYLNIKLILIKDSDTRIRLFYNYKYIQQWLSIQKNKELLKEGLIDETRFKEVYPDDLIKITEDKFQKIKEDYHPKHPYHWEWKIFKNDLNNRNPNISYIAKHLGHKVDYVKIYSTLSISVHSSPLIENIISEGKTKTLSPLFNEHIVHTAFISLDYSGKIVTELINKYCSSELCEEINTYINAYFVGLSEIYNNV